MEHFRTASRRAECRSGRATLQTAAQQSCRAGGLVITRQRPGTAKGFVFLTLEDETGMVNVIVRPDVYETYRRPIRSSSTLIVEGTLQKESGCVDLLAKKIWSFDDEGITRTLAIHSFQ